MTAEPGIKVSVVVPVYNPGADIEPLIRSLRDQSMPQEEFEAIFVDDGSTDGTGARLDALAAERANVTVIHIPNSGWPGRPRNVGIDAAKGEFIQFVDNDDHLGAEALERLYEMARKNHSDIVIGKVVTNFRSVADALFRADRSHASIHDAPLVSTMTPHKFFRTSFIREHGIRFPEGKRRLEDQLFVLPAYLAARNVSVLASYPCYYYLEASGRSNAATVQIVPGHYYESVRMVIAILVAGTAPGEERNRLMRRWYRNEILSRLSEPATLGQTAEFRHELFEVVRETERDLMTPEVVRGLPSMLRLRAALLQAGREADLYELAVRASVIQARVMVDKIGWRDGRLHINLTADFIVAGRDEPLSIVERDGRHLLDPELVAGLTDGEIDVGDEALECHIDAQLQDPESFVDWRPGVQSSVQLEPCGPPEGGRFAPRVRATIAIDPRTIAGGSQLPNGTWQVAVKLSGFGIVRSTRSLVTASTKRGVLGAIVGKPATAAVAAIDDGGQLRLEVNGHVPALASTVDSRNSYFTSHGTSVRVVLPIATSGTADIAAFAELRTKDGDIRLPASTMNSAGLLAVRIDARTARPSGAGGATLAVGLNGFDQPIVELGAVTAGLGWIRVPQIRRQPRRRIAVSSLRGPARAMFRRLPVSTQRLVRRAWRALRPRGGRGRPGARRRNQQ
ncbi:MAG: glycosyltransferase [Chloroflexota bacterium]